jgi:hypothetical protein
MNARLPDWQLRLEACVAERLAQPFAWGRLDCALFVGDCVRACTGHDPAAHVRGKYANAREAARLLRGIGDLVAAAVAVLGDEISPALAQPGDIGLIDNDGDPCLGVCMGAAWLAPGPSGLASVGLDRVSRSWRMVKEY